MAASRMRQLTVIVFIILNVAPCARGSASCLLHEPTDDGILRFQEEELVEVVFEGEFKEIPCHAENFCTINWKKDGRQIEESQRVQLRENQQVLRIESLRATDVGRYTCEAFNGKSAPVEKTVQLHVISQDCDADYVPINLQHHGCSNVSTNVGEDVTLACEFFVGLHKDYSWSWFKINESASANAPIFERWILLGQLFPDGQTNGTTVNVSQYHTGEVPQNAKDCDCAGCKSVLGVKLEIQHVTEKVFGTYVLNLQSGGTSSKVHLRVARAPKVAIPRVQPRDWHQYLTIPLVCVLGVCFILLLAWQRFKIDIKLTWKDHATKKDGSKTYDVYLSYDWNSEADRGFAMSLARQLGELGYKVFWEIHCLPGGDTDEDILEALETSSRCIIIFSPAYLASRRNLDVIFAVDNARHYRKEIIPIIFRDISAVTGDGQSKLVKKILSVQCLHFDKIQSQPLGKVQKIAQSLWRSPYSEKSLHKELRLRLPPPDRSSQHSTSDMNLISAEIPSHVSSRESINKYQSPHSAKSPGANDPSKCRQDSIDESATSRTSPVLNGLKLYPDISGLTNDVNLTFI